LLRIYNVKLMYRLHEAMAAVYHKYDSRVPLRRTSHVQQWNPPPRDCANRRGT